MTKISTYLIEDEIVVSLDGIIDFLQEEVDIQGEDCAVKVTDFIKFLDGYKRDIKAGFLKEKLNEKQIIT